MNRGFLRRAARWILASPGAIGAAVALAIVVLWAAGLWEVAELKWLDRLLRLRGPQRPGGEIVIVAVGESTFDELRRPWPLPRATIARAVENIQKANPRAVGIDVLFTEPSLFGAEDDGALARALGASDNVVLAALYSERRLDPAGSARTIRVRQSLLLPVEPLPASTAGAVNLLYDVDGFVRRAPLSTRFGKDRQVESFAAQLYRVAGRGGGPLRPPAASEVLINYRGGAGTFKTIPFEQVLRGEVEPPLLAGKIVLIGATSAALHDLFNTPFAYRDPMPGVEVHANILDNLLREDSLRAAGPWVSLLLLVLCAFLGTALGSWVSPPRSFWLLTVCWCALAAGTYIALTRYQVWIEQVPVHVALAGTYFAMLVCGIPHRRPSVQQPSSPDSPPPPAEDTLSHPS
jgi:CHASE2 domain-containing sensor protein